MKKSKLHLDFDVVEQARAYAKSVAEDTQGFIDLHTTTTVERAVCRLLGVDGVNEDGAPLPNVVVDHLVRAGRLENGAAFALGNAMASLGLSPQAIAEGVSSGALDLLALKERPMSEIRGAVFLEAQKSTAKIKQNAARRESFLTRFPERDGPYLYVIVATGNIYEDITQAQAAASQGADIIAVIRTTGQSLLDFVPYGATTEGFGGTYATQENFRLMREALNATSEKEKRYIRLCNYCSGLCMPEIAAMGALEGLDVMLNDALYGILFRDINMQRTLIDQYFSRIINGFAGVIINTGEDNYLTTADAVEEAHTVLASQLLNEQFARLSGLAPGQMGLGHAFEISPDVENGFLYEIAQAQMAREIFPDMPLKYMPPTKHMTGNIFKGHVQNTLFNIATVVTGQKIHLLGMLTEALHTPFMSDRALSIENAKYVLHTMKDIAGEISFDENGIIVRRAREVLQKATDLLREIDRFKLFSTLEKGVFADIKRQRDGGKGLDGVVRKGMAYFNPFVDLLIGGERG